MKLIMNADDFGLTENVNLAIVECFKAGIVKSTTLMVNQPAIEHAVTLIKQGLIPEVGLHLTLTSGKPILSAQQVPSLVDENGYFLKNNILLDKEEVNLEEVEAEFQAQYDKAIAYGVHINHLDSHHFAATFAPTKLAFIKFANRIGLPTRRADHSVPNQDSLIVNTPDVFDMGFFDEGVGLEKLQQRLKAHQKKQNNAVIELMCHVSLESDNMLKALSSYSDKRVDEYSILTSPALKHWLMEENIETIGYAQL